MNYHRRRPVYISLAVSLILTILYLFLQSQNVPDITNTVMAICAIVAAVAFWLEYHHNSQVNEAQFIMELNNQFIEKDKLMAVEHDLERYYSAVLDQDASKADTVLDEFKTTYDIDNPQRQDLVNYLVHLEGIATLVKGGILRLSTINDLMAYRYFIAVNNKYVQETEIIKYQEYYRGIIAIYDQWAKAAGKVPLSQDSLTQAIREAEREHMTHNSSADGQD